MATLRRFVSMALCVAVLFCFAAVTPSANAATVSELQRQLDQAKAETNRMRAEVANLEAANAPYEQQRNAIKKQINSLQNEIDLYQSRINACEKEISELNAKVKSLEADITRKINDFKQRLVALYMSDDSHLEDIVFLMSSTDLSDYLAKSELLESVSRRDKQQLDNILKSVDEVNKSKAQAEKTKAELDASKSEIDAKKKELNSQYTKVNSIVKTNEQEIADAQKEAAALAKVEKDIAAAIKKAQELENRTTGTGQFTWPLPGYYTIASPFGYRIHPLSGTRKLHAGTDICSNNGTVYGATIYAADSGTVILNAYNDGGYGYYVMIDHGNGYVTLYAHMKARSTLKVGQSVTRGKTVVGYVGATGGVTGPHLHFEVRKNGTPIEPMQFF